MENTALKMEEKLEEENQQIKKVIVENEIEVNGEKIKTIQFNFKKLSGFDLLKAEKITRNRGDTTPSIVYSMTYQMTVAALASKIALDTLLTLPAADCMAILAEANDFLFN